jgi:hypothetical protein
LERLQEIRSFLLESKGLSSSTIIDSGFAKKILEKRVLEMLLTYILLAAAEELMLLSRFEWKFRIITLVYMLLQHLHLERDFEDLQ